MMLDYLSEHKKQIELNNFALSYIHHNENRESFCELISYQLELLNILQELMNDKKNTIDSDFISYYLTNYQQQQKRFSELGFTDLIIKYLPDISTSKKAKIDKTLPHFADELSLSPPMIITSNGNNQTIPGIELSEPDFWDSLTSPIVGFESQGLSLELLESLQNPFAMETENKEQNADVEREEGLFFYDVENTATHSSHSLWNNLNSSATHEEQKKIDLQEDAPVAIVGRPIIANQKTDPSLKTQFIILDGKQITFDAFWKRHYFFFDKPDQEATLTEKKRADFHEDGTVWVDGRQIIWRPKKGLSNIHRPNLNDKEIAGDVFWNRHYFFLDKPEQEVTLAEKRRAQFHDDGTVWVDGQQIMWRQKLSYKTMGLININGKQITCDAFMRRHYFFFDQPDQAVTLAEKKRADFHGDGTVWIDGRQIIWNQKNGFYPSMRMVQIDGKHITRDAFKKRQYVFFDKPEQEVTLAEKNRARCDENGVVWVDERQIIWRKRNYSDNLPSKRKFNALEDTSLNQSSLFFAVGSSIISNEQEKPTFPTKEVYAPLSSVFSTLPSNKIEVVESEIAPPKMSQQKTTGQPLNSHSFFSVSPRSSVFHSSINLPFEITDKLNKQFSLLLDPNERLLPNNFIESLSMSIKENNFYGIVLCCTDLLEQYGDNRYLLTLRGEAYRRLNYFNLALKDLNKAIGTNKENTPAFLFRSVLNYQSNNIDAALNDLDVVMTQQPYDTLGGAFKDLFLQVHSQSVNFL